MPDADRIEDEHERLFSLARRLQQHLPRAEFEELLELLGSQADLVADLAAELNALQSRTKA